jgi:hypothetical protein
MKKLLLTAAVVTLSGVAHAHDYTGDLLCSVTDNAGRKTTWAFGNNTFNKDGSLGTMVETGASSSTPAKNSPTRPARARSGSSTSTA